MLVVVKLVGVAVIAFGVVAICNRDRGVPFALLLVIVMLVFWTFIAKRTAFGRHVYAVGGNAEAARRAGINVARIRIIVFMISGVMAGVGGVVLAARLNSRRPQRRRRHAAARRDRGRGDRRHEPLRRPRRGASALFGSLVIATIANGINTARLQPAIDLHRHGLILLLAVTLDTVSRGVREGRSLRAQPVRGRSPIERAWYTCLAQR